MMVRYIRKRNNQSEMLSGALKETWSTGLSKIETYVDMNFSFRCSLANLLTVRPLKLNIFFFFLDS